METPQPPACRAPRGWVLWGGVSVLVAAGMAIAYATAEVMITGALVDAPLIVLITLNALLVYRLGCSLSKDLGRLFHYLPTSSPAPQAAVNRLLGDPRLLLAGIGFAGIIALTVWRVEPWHSEAGQTGLRPWLCAFLFFNNLIIGAVLFAILHFWHILLRDLPKMDISIHNLSSPGLCALLKVNSRLVMGTALVASLAVCSIPLSSYEMNPVTKVFSGFALAVVIATYAVPILPLSNLLAEHKAEALDRLEQLIEAHLRHRSGLAPQPHVPGSVDQLPPLADLLEARSLVLAVRTLPPGGQFSVSAAAIVAFLSFLPTLIDYAISRLP